LTTEVDGLPLSGVDSILQGDFTEELSLDFSEKVDG
jgi:hypothetical protein